MQAHGPLLSLQFRRRTRIIGALIVLWCCILSTVLEAVEPMPGGYRLRRVEVHGLSATQEEEVKLVVPLEVGDPITQQSLDELERRLEGLNLPKDRQKVKLRPTVMAQDGETTNGVDLVIDYTPPMTIAQLRFLPLIAVDEEALALAAPMKVGDKLENENLQATLDALKKFAADAGFPDVIVTPHYYSIGNAQASVSFFLEGVEPAKLHKVRFDNAGFGNAPKIRKYFRELETMDFDKGTTVTASLLLEVEKISTDLMRAQGYLDVQTVLDDTRVSNRGVRVTYSFERGTRYRLEQTFVEGDRFPADFWRPATIRFDRKHFTTARVREIEESVKQRSQTEGYMAPDIKVEFDTDREQKTVAVTMDVDEGTTSVMGRVRLERDPGKRGYGKSWYHRNIAPPVQDAVLEKQARAYQGEQLYGKFLTDAERRLWRLGILDEVEVDTVATSDTMVRDIVLKVRERRTAGLEASIGWNEELGAITRMSVTERNVGGRADVASVGGYYSLSGDGYGGDVSYFDRYWTTGERLLGREREPSLLYGLHLSDLVYDEYYERRNGGILRLSYLTGPRLGPWSNTIQLRAEEINYFPFREPQRYSEDFDSYYPATVAYHITYDTRDRGEFDSTEGFIFDTGIETGYADGTLVKWSNLAEWHKRLARRWGWVTRAQFGLMPWDAGEVGLSDRYFVGGVNTLRGFSNRGVGPVDDKEDDLHIGGATFTSLQNEIRLIASDDIDIPLFIDTGTLNQSPLDYDRPRASVGTGLRVKVPGVTERAYLYFAENLIKEEDDDTQWLHFGFRFGI